MDSEPVKHFNAELTSVYESKPPVTKTKIQEISKAAIKGLKYYKHVVFSVEKFIAKCQPEYKIPCLYIIDSIIRQSKHTFKQKDVYGDRFQKNMADTIEKLHNCPTEDKPKIARTLHLWVTHKVYPPEVINEYLNICKKHGVETDVAVVERMVKGEKADMSLYASGGKPREERKDKGSRERRSRFEASTPPGKPPPAAMAVASDETPEEGISEKTLLALLQETGNEFGGVFASDISTLRRAHQIVLMRLKEKVQKAHEARGDHIKNILSRGFNYSDDEDDAQDEPPKTFNQQEIQRQAFLHFLILVFSFAKQLLKESSVVSQLRELQNARFAAFNKIADEARQRTAASQAQAQNAAQNQFGLANLPGMPGASTASSMPNLPGLPPGLQLPPNLAGLPGFPQQGMPPLNFMNLISANPLLAAAVQNQIAAGLPPGLPPGFQGLPGLPPNLHQGLPPNLPSGLQPPTPTSMSQNMASMGLPFLQNRPPPNMLQGLPPNFQQLMQQGPPPEKPQDPQHNLPKDLAGQSSTAQLRSEMEKAMEERMSNSRDDRNRDGRDRRRDDRDRPNRDRSRERRRSRSRDRRDERRDPRGQETSETDRERDRKRRHMGLPPKAKSEHLIVASCTLWFGRLPANCSEEEIKVAIKDTAFPKRISLVGSKACAYVTLADRKAAYNVIAKYEKHLEIRSKSLKISWAIGPGLKNQEATYGEFWDGDKGISQIPWSKLPQNLIELTEGGWLDLASLPPHLEGKIDEFALPTHQGPINPLTGAPMPQFTGMPGINPQFTLPPAGLGMSGAPGMASGLVPPPQMGGGMPPPGMQLGMVPPPNFPGFPPQNGGFPGGRPGAPGPPMPGAPPPPFNGGPPPMGGMPPGGFNMPPPQRGGFNNSPNFRGGFEPRGNRGRGGFGQPMMGGDRGGFAGDRGGFRGRGWSGDNFRGGHGQWRGRGDGGFVPRGGFGGPPPMGVPLPDMTGFPGVQFPPPMNVHPNDDSQVSSTVNDDEPPTVNANVVTRAIDASLEKEKEAIADEPMDADN
ncbi:unnamed protein product, partial [Mesorhabditis spiculigera]